MRLIFPDDGRPVAGETWLVGFAFDDDERRQSVRIIIRQGRRILGRFDCPDPPCYEFKVPLSSARPGAKLSVEVFRKARPGLPRRRLMSKNIEVQGAHPSGRST